MKLFRRKPEPLPDKSVEAQQEAIAQQHKANALLTLVTRIAASSKATREENHIAHAIAFSMDPRSNK